MKLLQRNAATGTSPLNLIMGINGEGGAESI